MKDRDPGEREGGPAYGEFQVLFDKLGASLSFHCDVSPEEMDVITELREMVEAATPPPVASVTGS
jgi:hypothetical protein